MAKLSTAQRKSLPKSDFGLPKKNAAGRGSYPMPDKTHARIAKAYAARFASPSQKAKIDAKANKILGEDKADKKRDKKMGIKEGSKKDQKYDFSKAEKKLGVVGS